jgi:hypothetical protein
MSQTEKVVYTAKTHTTGGRENGASRSPMAALISGFRLPARRASAPILSNCTPPVGPHASKFDSARCPSEENHTSGRRDDRRRSGPASRRRRLLPQRSSQRQPARRRARGRPRLDQRSPSDLPITPKLRAATSRLRSIWSEQDPARSD